MNKEFPLLFPKCPNCGCTETTAQLAYDSEVVAKDRGPAAFASSEKRAVPLTDPMKAALVLPVLVEHYDTCANCGLRRCTKAEITQGKIGMAPLKKPPGM